MSKSKSVLKKALKKERTENQNISYKKTLEPDFQFVMQLIMFGIERVSEDGDINVNDLLFVDCNQFTSAQKEIIKNFQRYVMLDKHGDDNVVNVEIIENGVH